MKNLTEYITEAGFDSNAQIAKNREIINKLLNAFDYGNEVNKLKKKHG